MWRFWESWRQAMILFSQCCWLSAASGIAVLIRLAARRPRILRMEHDIQLGGPEPSPDAYSVCWKTPRDRSHRREREGMILLLLGAFFQGPLLCDVAR